MRVHWRGLRWLDARGERFDIMEFLDGLGAANSGEAHILIGRGRGGAGWQPLATRLIALRLPPDKVVPAQARILKANSRKGRQVQPQTLKAATHVLFVTSLDREEYPPERIGRLYRLRWQVELAFKRLKSLLNLDTLRARDKGLARAWIYTNLLAAFLIEDMIRPAPDSPP